MPSITTFLTYDDQAETAVRYYTSIFENSKIVNTMRAGDKVMSLTFELLGQTFMALNGGPTFSFAHGFSLFVSCDTQEQIDRYWNQLTDGGKPVQCGWLVDRFGLIDIPADVYFIDKLPVALDPIDMVLIAVVSMAIAFGATIYPALQAARLQPVDAIRGEVS